MLIKYCCRLSRRKNNHSYTRLQLGWSFFIAFSNIKGCQNKLNAKYVDCMVDASTPFAECAKTNSGKLQVWHLFVLDSGNSSHNLHTYYVVTMITMVIWSYRTTLHSFHFQTNSPTACKFWKLNGQSTPNSGFQQPLEEDWTQITVKEVSQFSHNEEKNKERLQRED